MNAAFAVSLLLVFCCSANAYLKTSEFGEEFKKLTDEWHDICSDVTGATDDQIQGTRVGIFPDDEKMKRYIWCLWRVAKIVDRNFNINFEPVRHAFTEEMKNSTYLKSASKCVIDAKNSGLKENYEKVYQVEQCLYKIEPELFIMF